MMNADQTLGLFLDIFVLIKWLENVRVNRLYKH